MRNKLIFPGAQTLMKLYTVDVQNTSTFGSIAALGIQGLVGLGPGYSSVIKNTIGAGGDTILDNIFQVSIGSCALPSGRFNFSILLF